MPVDTIYGTDMSNPIGPVQSRPQNVEYSIMESHYGNSLLIFSQRHSRNLSLICLSDVSKRSLLLCDSGSTNWPVNCYDQPCD